MGLCVALRTIIKVAVNKGSRGRGIKTIVRNPAISLSFSFILNFYVFFGLSSSSWLYPCLKISLN